MSQDPNRHDNTDTSVMSSAVQPSGPGVIVADPRRWNALGVIALAQLMVVLDASIVNLGPPIGQA